MSSKFLDKTGLDTLWAKIKSTFQTLGNLVTAWGSTPSDTKYPSEKLVKDALDGKVPIYSSGSSVPSSDNLVCVKIQAPYQRNVNKSQVLLYDITSFADGTIVNNDGAYVTFKGFLIGGKPQGYGTQICVKMCAKVAFDQITVTGYTTLQSDSDTCGPEIIKRVENGVNKYYLSIYCSATLYQGNNVLVGQFQWRKPTGIDDYSYKNGVICEYTPGETYPGGDPLWDRLYTYTSNVHAATASAAKSGSALETAINGKVSSITKNGSTITPSGGVANIGYMPTTRQPSPGTVESIIQQIRVLPGGSMGSVLVNAASTISEITIAAVWYNYIWLPHCTGQDNGDNQDYGTLILTPLTSNPYLIIIEGSRLGGSSPTYRAKRVTGDVTTEATIATGDKLLFSDVSDSGKNKRMGTGFDTGVTNTLLRRDGTFAKALYADEGWGGTWGPALAPMDTYFLQQRNCFFGAKPSAIKVEYSTDGGSTWIDYGLNDEQKQYLFSQYAGISVYCGKNTHILPTYTGSIVGTKDLSNANVADQRLRITICCRSLATEGTTTQTDKWMYATIRRVGIYMSTNSASKGPRHCVFTAKKREDFNAGNDTWTNFGDYAISGDSGWNSIPCNNKAASNGITFGDSFSGQYAAFRFEVWSEGVNDSPAPSQTGNMIITKIVAFSELCWTNNSSNPNLANFGMPCTVNASTGSASFPKGITSGVAIPIGSGGTGATTAKGASYNINAGMNSGDSDDIVDTSRFAFNYASPSATTGGLYYRTAPKVWEWIKSKISSVLGLTATSYGGNAATATAAAGYTSGGAIDAALQGKVDKETGKGLSTNDFTDTYKSSVDSNTSARHTHSNKSVLDGISSTDVANWNAAEPNVQSDWNQTTSTADDYIKNKPTLGTAAAKDVPASGNASTTQVVLGSDSRLSDARPASDVSAWAKSETKPAYTASEVGAVPTSRTVNGKALSSNISLTASDVGAAPGGTRTTSGSTVTSNIAWCIKITRLSTSGKGYARITVDLERHTDADDFGFVDVCVKTHTSDWHAFAAANCRRTEATQFGQCRYQASNFSSVGGVLYIGVVCSAYASHVVATITGDYADGQFSIETGDYSAVVAQNWGTALQTRFQVYANYNGSNMAAIGSDTVPVYIDQYGQVTPGKNRIQAVSSLNTSTMDPEVLYVL